MSAGVTPTTAPSSAGADAPIDRDKPRLTANALWWLIVMACALMVLGSKFWLIANYGSPTPFWDQWDGEAAFLYDPYLSGHIPLANWFSLHNEHRILVTRVLAIVLLEFAGHWDVMLQMLVNAVLHTGVMVVLLYLLRDLVGRRCGVVLALFTVLVFVIPFGWENALEGFQNEFSFLLLFTFLSLALTLSAAANTRRWWGGVTLSVVAFFCLASGAFTPLIGAATASAQLAVGRRRGIWEFAGIGLQLVLAASMVHAIPAIAAHVPLRAHSLQQYFTALWQSVGWPLPENWSLPHLLAPFVVFGPLAALAVRVLRRAYDRSAAAWLCLGIGGWVLAQHLSLAYGRATGVNDSRYLDLETIGLIVNLAALIAVLRDATVTLGRWMIVAALAPAVWLAVVCTGMGGVARLLPAALADKARIGRVETENLGVFLKSGDVATLRDKPILAIPYPDADRLAKLASLPTIRGILPVELVDDPAARDAAQSRLWTRGRLGWIAERLRRLGQVSGLHLFCLGLAGLLAAGFGSCLMTGRCVERRPRPPEVDGS